MVRFEEHLEKIKKTREEMQTTKSPMRRRDLERSLKKLQRDYDQAMNQYTRAKESKQIA